MEDESGTTLYHLVCDILNEDINPYNVEIVSSLFAGHIFVQKIPIKSEDAKGKLANSEANSESFQGFCLFSGELPLLTGATLAWDFIR